MAALIARGLTEKLSTLTDYPRPMLIFTGHSAGGAIASLLYAHILNAPEPLTPLSSLRDRFATIHCLTFGAPPVTTPALRQLGPRSQFLAFVNEGDPVPRCDQKYIDSLLRLYITPEPVPEGVQRWPCPEPVLHNAGDVVLVGKRVREDGLTALLKPGGASDGSLREFVMGNPRAHSTDVYLEKLRFGRTVGAVAPP